MSTILLTTATCTIPPERILNYTAKYMFLLREVHKKAHSRFDFQKYCILPSDSILVEASDLNEMVQ
jgi:hypothetical protein